MRYRISGGAVLFANGERGEIICSAGISTPLPPGDYRLVGRVFVETRNHTGVQVLLRKASLRDGSTSTVLETRGLSGSQNGLRTTESDPGRLSIDLDEFTWWVQVHLESSELVATKWGILNVALDRA